MKKFLSVCIVLFLCLFVSVSAINSRMADNDNLLTESEREKLEQQFNRISANTQFDIIAITVKSEDGKNIGEYSKQYFQSKGYGIGKKGSVMLAICLDSREWYILTVDDANDIFNSAELDKIGDKITSDLTNGNFYNAFEKYGDVCEDIITDSDAYKNRTSPTKTQSTVSGQYTNTDYGGNDEYNGKMSVGKTVGIAVVIGFIVALISVTVMKRQLKSVRYRKNAEEYVRNGSFALIEKSDRYMYRTVDRVRKPEPQDGSSSSHSSGHRYGGGGGKF